MQTIDEVKRWLARGIGINAEITALLEAKEKALEQCTSTTSTLSTCAVSGTKNPHKFDKYIELESSIDEKIDELVGVKVEIIKAINRLQSSAQRTVLTERYINCKPWEDIAGVLGYEERTIYRIHGDALLELFKLVSQCQ